LLLCLWAGAAPAAEGETLRVYVMAKPPATWVGADGQPGGPLVQRLQQVAQLAGLHLQWQVVPLKRSLMELQKNDQALCALGAYRNAEREQWARFSLPLWQDERQVLVALPEAAQRLRRHASLHHALLDESLRLVLVDGVSYGAQLDLWIQARKSPPQRVTAGSDRVLGMLARARGDFTISDSQELAVALDQQPEVRAARLETVALPGMPEGSTRHLICSLKVPAAWLQRIDAAIAQGATARPHTAP
jgi:uncharacterized protein (TIGR02285 family)